MGTKCDPMTDTQELNELYEIMTEIGIWEDTHLSQDEHGWGYTDEYEFRGTMAEHHALHIARGIAEEWLLERGWLLAKGPDYTRYSPHLVREIDNAYLIKNSLPDALRYAHSSSNP